MKLIYCNWCGDLFKLGRQKKFCECGRSGGVYVNNLKAIIAGPCSSVAIGNGSFIKALNSVNEFKVLTDNGLENRDYIELSKIKYAWCRPNEGKGNPHTTWIEMKDFVGEEFSKVFNKILEESKEE